MKEKDNRKKEDNFLLYVPIKKHTNWELKNNCVYLIFNHDRLIEKIFSWLTKRPTVTDIELDEVGTAVWQLIDNSRSVYDISESLESQFGDKIEPLYSRLILYLRYLSRQGWIKFEKRN